MIYKNRSWVMENLNMRSGHFLWTIFWKLARGDNVKQKLSLLTTLFAPKTYIKIKNFSTIHVLWAPIHWADGCLTASSREFSVPRESGLYFSNRSEIWQAPPQQRCRDVCQSLQHPNSRLRKLTSFGSKTSYCLLNKGLVSYVHRQRTWWFGTL